MPSTPYSDRTAICIQAGLNARETNQMSGDDAVLELSDFSLSGICIVFDGDHNVKCFIGALEIAFVFQIALPLAD